MGGSYSFDRLQLFALSKKLVVACYAITAGLPPEEKTVLSQYIRQSALSAHLHILQSSFEGREEVATDLLQQAQNALVVIDAALDVLVEVGLVPEGDTDEVVRLSAECYLGLQRLKSAK